MTGYSKLSSALDFGGKKVLIIGGSDGISGAALFFASPLASYITGQHLAVDGGLTI